MSDKKAIPAEWRIALAWAAHAGELRGLLRAALPFVVLNNQLEGAIRQALEVRDPAAKP